MAHGYLGDGYGSHGDIDPDRDDDRERNWRGRDDRRGRERERGSMFGDWDRSRLEQDRRGDRDYRGERFAATGDFSTDGRSFSAHPDDHYRSWRDRHMSELDRDYADYCREREQQFHSEFDQWRRQKYGNPQPLRTGMTQTGMSHDPSGMTQAAEENSPETASEVSVTGAATLGTNSEGRTRGRR